MTSPARAATTLAMTGLAVWSCAGEPAGAPSASATTAPNTSTAPTATTSAVPAAPRKGAGTKGEVARRDEVKIGFTIDLPDGLKDVSDADVIATYAKEKGVFDGVTFTVMAAREDWVKAGLDKTLAELQKSPDFTKNQVKILEKGTTPSGWYFASSIVEGAKKAVLLTAITTKGDKSLMCKGNVEGAEAETPEKVVPVLVASCKSLAIE